MKTNASGRPIHPSMNGVGAKLAQHGRGDDTIVAHINPAEAGLLRAAGGKGTPNPKTGLLEFDADPSFGNDYNQSDKGRLITDQDLQAAIDKAVGEGKTAQTQGALANAGGWQHGADMVPFSGNYARYGMGAGHQFWQPKPAPPVPATTGAVNTQSADGGMVALQPSALSAGLGGGGMPLHPLDGPATPVNPAQQAMAARMAAPAMRPAASMPIQPTLGGRGEEFGNGPQAPRYTPTVGFAPPPMRYQPTPMQPAPFGGPVAIPPGGRQF